MSSSAATGRAFEGLLEYLSRSRGFDFRVYKRATLMRRFEKRLQHVGVADFVEYMDYLEVHHEEFDHLFNTILINVTSFFRDQASWAFIREEVVPRILASKGAGEPVRAWTAGCASGEEPFTLAMVLAEALGPGDFASRVKIYASDIDDDALASARAASFDPSHMTGVPEDLREKYFDAQRDRFVFRPEFRRSIIFGRHNVVRDAPISRLDLLVCRNTLMYFNAETQAQILARFHFALGDRGLLFLGRAEMLAMHTGLFAPFNLRHRVFTKGGRATLRDRLLALPEAAPTDFEPSVTPKLREATLEAAPAAIFIVDLAGTLLLANTRARSMFGVMPRDIGRPFFDLAVAQSPVDLRPLVQAAYRDGHPITIPSAERRQPGDDVQFLRVQVNPVRDENGEATGVVVMFEDLTHEHRLQSELERVQEQLEAATEELQTTTGELETTNEELQSSNEELETTNEELQSANEELETMNEELQSTNEELQTINEELRQRTDEAGRATDFMQSIFAGLSAGVVVVDGKSRVLAWSHRAEDLWGLRENEAVGQSFFGLDIGLPMDMLKAPLRTILADGAGSTLLLEATNRRGKSIQCRITLSPLLGENHSRDGVIVLMEEWDTARSGPVSGDGK